MRIPPLYAAALLAALLITNWGSHYETPAEDPGEATTAESHFTAANHGTDFGISAGVAGHQAQIALVSRGVGPLEERIQSKALCACERDPIQTPNAQTPQNKPPPSVSDGSGQRNPSEPVHLVFEITAYSSGYESTQKKPGEDGYGITATGTVATEGRTIAADWSVLPPGSVVEIEGLPGQYTVEDKGCAVQGDHIDLYMQNVQSAIEWGRQQREVTIIHLGKNE